jgi:hypothetical protein
MGIGFGGGFGPLRARVSTRGISGGVGPFSAGSGWGDFEKFIGYVFALTGIVLLGFWPYMLGPWVARKLDSSVTETSWFLELIYLLSIYEIAKRVMAKRKAIKWEHRKKDLLIWQSIYSEITENIRKDPYGFEHSSVPKGEKMLLRTLEDVYLVEPRVVERGAEKVQKAVAVGRVIFTDKAIRFFGQTKKVEWRVDRIESTDRGSDYLAFSVSNRKNISGIGGEEWQIQKLIGAFLWSIDSHDHNYPEDALKHFEEMASRISAELSIHGQP